MRFLSKILIFPFMLIFLFLLTTFIIVLSLNLTFSNETKMMQLLQTEKLSLLVQEQLETIESNSQFDLSTNNLSTNEIPFAKIIGVLDKTYIGTISKEIMDGIVIHYYNPSVPLPTINIKPLKSTLSEQLPLLLKNNHYLNRETSRLVSVISLLNKYPINDFTDFKNIIRLNSNYTSFTDLQLQVMYNHYLASWHDKPFSYGSVEDYVIDYVLNDYIHLDTMSETLDIQSLSNRFYASEYKNGLDSLRDLQRFSSTSLVIYLITLIVLIVLIVYILQGYEIDRLTFFLGMNISLISLLSMFFLLQDSLTNTLPRFINTTLNSTGKYNATTQIITNFSITFKSQMFTVIVFIGIIGIVLYAIHIFIKEEKVRQVIRTKRLFIQFITFFLLVFCFNQLSKHAKSELNQHLGLVTKTIEYQTSDEFLSTLKNALDEELSIHFFDTLAPTIQ